MTAVRSAIRWPLLGPLVVPLALATLLSAAAPARAAQPAASIEMDSAITPVTVRLLITAIDRAQSDGAQALIVQLNNPGGLARAMRSMAQIIQGSPIPVILYAAP